MYGLLTKILEISLLLKSSCKGQFSIVVSIVKVNKDNASLIHFFPLSLSSSSSSKSFFSSSLFSSSSSPFLPHPLPHHHHPPPSPIPHLQNPPPPTHPNPLSHSGLQVRPSHIQHILRLTLTNNESQIYT